MKCPECGYDGQQWMSDTMYQDDGSAGYVCPECNHHLIVSPTRDERNALSAWLDQLERYPDLARHLTRILTKHMASESYRNVTGHRTF